MSINEDFKVIMEYAHFWNWLPDWDIVQEIYDKIPNSYSVLTPFAFSYLEELIRSMTSEYSIGMLDLEGKTRSLKIGTKLIELAIKENQSKSPELLELLEKSKLYYVRSHPDNAGENRNSILHGFMHSRFWERDSFENLVHHIAQLSKYAGF